MIPPPDGVYFNTPGVASVTWDKDAQLVVVVWEGWAVVVPQSVVADMNLRDSLDKASGEALQVGYVATVEEARGWVTG